MSRRSYDCRHCGQRFDNITDSMSHFVEQHDRGFVPRSQRTMRLVGCWGCASYIRHDEPTCPTCGVAGPNFRDDRAVAS